MSTEIQNEENLAAHVSNSPLRKALAMAEHREQAARVENNALRAKVAKLLEALEHISQCPFPTDAEAAIDIHETADRALADFRAKQPTESTTP